MKYLALKRQQEALSFRVGTTLDVGSGIYPIPDALHVDIDRRTKPDYVCDITQGMPFAPESFDTIVAMEFIEHLHNHDQLYFMMDSWKTLRPQGRLIMTFPNSLGFWGKFNRLQWAIREHTTERKYLNSSMMHTHVGIHNARWFTDEMERKPFPFKVIVSKPVMGYTWLVVAIKEEPAV